MQLYHAVPENQGVENGLKRAKQMVDFEWSPLKPIPSNLSFKRPDGTPQYVDAFLKAGQPEKGVIYSSARINDKHVGFEVALETFATALENPDSVLYTRNLHGTSGHGNGCWYGIVCSAFASYVHDLPRQIVCKDWPGYEGISPVPLDMEEYPACLKALKLLDIVLNPKQHIAVITDLLSDASGEIQGIEVSESVMPVCCRRVFTPEEFRRYFLDYGFSIFRNACTDRISYTPCAYSYVEGDEELIDEDNFYDMADAETVFSFMCDYGNRANYALGEPVVISVFDETIREISVFDNEDRETVYPVRDGKCIIKPESAGIWFAQAVNGCGSPESVTWFVYDFRTAADKKVYRPGEPIELSFRDSLTQQDCSHYYVKNVPRYKKYTAVITPEEREAGKLVIPGIDEPGTYYITVYSRSPYAQYGSRELEITVTEAPHEFCFLGWPTADAAPVNREYRGIDTPWALYDALSAVWCRETCPPRLREQWSEQNKTLGQCSITAFLAQDIFGGKVYGILLPDGNYHCYNVTDRCTFDLTSEQFGEEKLPLTGGVEQFREVHFADEGKRARYELLKKKLKEYLKN